VVLLIDGSSVGLVDKMFRNTRCSNEHGRAFHMVCRGGHTGGISAGNNPESTSSTVP
jgi:hypothetical protein